MSYLPFLRGYGRQPQGEIEGEELIVDGFLAVVAVGKVLFEAFNGFGGMWYPRKEIPYVRLLVTGSTGHIGRVLVKVLETAGHELRTSDRTAGPRDSAWEHVPADLRNIQAVRGMVQGVDAVVHLGALAHDRAGTPEDVLSVNVQGTWNLLLACVEAGVERMVFFSSVNALGNFLGLRKSTYLPIDDAYPRHPMSPYQLSKHLGEEACRCFTDRYGLTTVCLRPVYVAAPDHYIHWREPRVGPRADWGRGDYWAYVDVRDVCDAAVRGLTVADVTHDAFLLTADDTSMAAPTAELVDTYYADTPWTCDRAAYLADAPHRSLVDCSHAKEVLGWQPQHSWRSVESSNPA